MNNFGGNWTSIKIEILVEYAKAYLTIMDKHAPQNSWKLMYFDGFAGSGLIKKPKKGEQEAIVGAASRILEISSPRSFDMYYFVEKDIKYSEDLKLNTKQKFPSKSRAIHIVNEDCNKKIQDFSSFLSKKEQNSWKALAYIDPCGMQLNWESLKTLEKLSVDVWILVPTGMGVSRLLKRNGEISDAWVKKLETFLGMKKEDIIKYFYEEKTNYTLFGEEKSLHKKKETVQKSAILYSEKLKELFKFVSKPFILKNDKNAVLFHFFMASNNQTALKIADDIIEKYNNL